MPVTVCRDLKLRSDWNIYNGHIPRGSEVAYIDNAQSFVLAGCRREPIMTVVSWRANGNGDHELFVPFPMAPCCEGWVWRLCAGTRAYAPDPYIELSVWESSEDGSTETEISLYRSTLDPDALKSMGLIEADESFNNNWPILGPDPKAYEVVPEVPSPGILQVVPLRRFRLVGLQVNVRQMNIGYLQLFPIPSGKPLKTMGV